MRSEILTSVTLNAMVDTSYIFSVMEKMHAAAILFQDVLKALKTNFMTVCQSLNAVF